MAAWDEIRRDFPATARSVFLNAASGSPMPRPVSEAVGAYLREASEGDEWLAWLERAKPMSSSGLPEVDLVNVWDAAQQLEPVAVSNCDEELHGL